MKTAPDYDSPWKDLLDRFFRQFVAFFFPVAHDGIDWAHGLTFLDKELQKITADAAIGRRYVDKLVKVRRKGGGELWLLIHVEVQGSRETGFELRIFVYNFRLFNRYRIPVASFVILTDDDPNWHPTEYREEVFGTTTTFRFEAVKLLDFAARWEELEASDNIFAVVVMAHLRLLSTRGDMAARKHWKLRLTKMLYERGYDKLTVVLLFKFLDWLMWLPDELQQEFNEELIRYEEEKRMPYVTSIERKGMQKGLEKGMQQGMQQGSSRQLLRVLRERFGESAEMLRAELAALSVEQLEGLTGAALSARTVEEFAAALPQTAQ